MLTAASMVPSNKAEMTGECTTLVVSSETENKGSTLMIMMMGLCLLLFAFVAGMVCSCWCSAPLKKHDENKAIEKSINKEI